jgi:hypothetical protein
MGSESAVVTLRSVLRLQGMTERVALRGSLRIGT